MLNVKHPLLAEYRGNEQVKLKETAVQTRFDRAVQLIKNVVQTGHQLCDGGRPELCVLHSLISSAATARKCRKASPDCLKSNATHKRQACETSFTDRFT